MDRRHLVAALAALPCLSGRSRAETRWAPERPVRIVVPFAAGGSTDLAARLLAEALAPLLGQPVVVENRAGAGGNIASEHVARSAPDGCTLIMATTSTHATNPALYKHLPFSPSQDFAAVSLVAFTPNVLVVNPAVPARSLQELIAYGKANPGRLNYGTAGPGSSQHLAAALFGRAADIRMTHVPYRGGAPAAADLVAGRVDLVFSAVIEVLDQIKVGQLRPLGVTTTRRTSQLPEVPAIGEMLPGFELAIWVGLFAPAGTPPAAINRLSQETMAALRAPRLRDRILQLGSEPVGSSAEEFAAFYARELPKVAELVRLSGATID
ncbi:tripartite tricarboxylate transporter substrate binding protein [Roseomonas sp. OT10]|uniref:Bug family tripartite tricarboxylate transporter substrate binding protein n=1 Tax=Roseomonas cutis TaxID=2897332 RepID=UPI001E575D47|nr:tripartite tricarboxylate transporter substrate binding protein [Roseomonas sp. OT10]UFN48414.1 tripartite tricarboxylate transporter substrate binding protein [Roseomonas sp. OT10]